MFNTYLWDKGLSPFPSRRGVLLSYQHSMMPLQLLISKFFVQGLVQPSSTSCSVCVCVCPPVKLYDKEREVVERVLALLLFWVPFLAFLDVSPE